MKTEITKVLANNPEELANARNQFDMEDMYSIVGLCMVEAEKMEVTIDSFLYKAIKTAFEYGYISKAARA